jgi:hypothetical protein
MYTRTAHERAMLASSWQSLPLAVLTVTQDSGGFNQLHAIPSSAIFVMRTSVRYPPRGIDLVDVPGSRRADRRVAQAWQNLPGLRQM